MFADGRSARKSALECLAEPPDAADEVYFFEDIPQLSESEVRRELDRRRLASVATELSPWSRERQHRLAAELELRRALRGAT